jgi:uncharacterized protein with GYD domain
MSTYVTLVRFTQQGIERIKESPARFDAAKQAGQALGVELKSWYLTMGQYDIVGVIEAPDDETMAKIALALGAQGNFRTETMRAFSVDEYRAIVAALP